VTIFLHRHFYYILLTVDIVQGRYNTEEAKKVYVEVTGFFIMNLPAPYVETLQFKPSAEAPRFTD
jgi:hypothetical protein